MSECEDMKSLKPYQFTNNNNQYKYVHVLHFIICVKKKSIKKHSTQRIISYT